MLLSGLFHYAAMTLLSKDLAEEEEEKEKPEESEAPFTSFCFQQKKTHPKRLPWSLCNYHV